MSAVVLLWRAQLRRQWRSWALLALVMAIGVGAGLACLAGARRTASAFDRYATGDRFLDVNSGHGLPPEEAEAAIAGLDGVGSHLTLVGFAGSVEDLDPTAIKYYVAPWDDSAGRFRPTLREGRYPDPERVDEVMVLGDGAQRSGIEVGDRLTVQLLGRASGTTASGAESAFGQTYTHPVTVVGLADDPMDSVADATYDRTGMIFTPAFARANVASQRVWSASDLVAAPGSDEDDLREQLNELGWTIDENRTTAETRVQDAIRPVVAVLALLGALLLATTLLVVGQALARRADATGPDRYAVRAMGASRRRLRAVDGAAALSVAVPGVVLAVLVTIAMSTLFPTGSVARLDPAHGHFVDGTVLVLGALASVVALVVLGRSRSRRSTPVAAAARPLPAAFGALGPQFTPGLRLAVGGTTRERYDFWRSVALTTGGLCLLVGAIAFVGSLAELRDEPRRYGAGWDLTARNAFGDVAPDAVAALTASDDDIEGIAGGTLSSVFVDDQLSVPMMAFSPITADLWPTVTAGTTPRADDEVLVGADVLAALDAEIGDEVTIRGASQTNALPGTEPSPPSAGDPSVRATVVGTAVFPSIELPGLDPARLGNGIAMTWSGYRSLTARSGFEDPAPDMTFFDLADGVDPALVAERYPDGLPEAAFGAPTEWLTSLAPAEVIETDRATGLIGLVIALLAIVVTASLVHALTGSVRDHRRDYATLKAIGFTRGQIVSLVAWQSLTPVVVALAIALPVGTALGRWCWQLLADMIGVVGAGVVPLLGLLAVAAVALVAAGLVAVVPALTVARAPAATLLRDE